MGGKIVFKGVFPSMGMGKNVIGLPGFTPFDFSAANMASLTGFSQDYGTFICCEFLPSGTTDNLFLDSNFMELFQPIRKPNNTL